MTTSPWDSTLEPARIAIRSEILRWNPVMNLVSRQDTPRHLDRLLEQCTAGFGLAVNALEDLGTDMETMGYVDVGSGNGLPGLLWAAGIAGCRGQGPVWLVEPRKRRAWFLARVARQSAFPDVTVVAGRWGDPLPKRSTPGDILISMKALRLSEVDVLDGLERGLGHGGDSSQHPQRIAVVRFLGPEPSQDRALVQDLRDWGAAKRPRWQQTGCRTLEGPGVRLLATTYTRS